LAVRWLLDRASSLRALLMLRAPIPVCRLFWMTANET